ncbi:MAG: universal stress protein [Opitutaceae bacterium]|nr:universal stress protein [Opitutaceae bacterium]
MKRPKVAQPRVRTAAPAPGAIRLKSILVPTDFSPASNVALQYAAALAAPFAATITLLHIAEVGSMGYEHGAKDFPRMESFLRLAAEKQIADCVPPGRAVEFKIGRGWPFGGERADREIVRMALRQRADLIVIATHGQTGLDRLILGSTAERVVRHAPCPVLVARAAAHAAVKTKPRRRQ